MLKVWLDIHHSCSTLYENYSGMQDNDPRHRKPFFFLNPFHIYAAFRSQPLEASCLLYNSQAILTKCEGCKIDIQSPSFSISLAVLIVMFSPGVCFTLHFLHSLPFQDLRASQKGHNFSLVISKCFPGSWC